MLTSQLQILRFELCELSLVNERKKRLILITYQKHCNIQSLAVILFTVSRDNEQMASQSLSIT